jgi:hypothetical protein
MAGMSLQPLTVSHPDSADKAGCSRGNRHEDNSCRLYDEVFDLHAEILQLIQHPRNVCRACFPANIVYVLAGKSFLKFWKSAGWQRESGTKRVVGTAAGMCSSFQVREIMQARSCPSLARLCGANKSFLLGVMHFQVYEYACSDSVIIKSSESFAEINHAMVPTVLCKFPFLPVCVLVYKCIHTHLLMYIQMLL